MGRVMRMSCSPCTTRIIRCGGHDLHGVVAAMHLERRRDGEHRRGVDALDVLFRLIVRRERIGDGPLRRHLELAGLAPHAELREVEDVLFILSHDNEARVLGPG